LNEKNVRATANIRSTKSQRKKVSKNKIFLKLETKELNKHHDNKMIKHPSHHYHSHPYEAFEYEHLALEANSLK
jgi:hypothetical protein